MKKLLPFAFAFFFTLTLHAELHYTNYGSDGWRIAMNENVVVDIDDDGYNDFYINQANNEIGFTPIFGMGCFSSLSSDAYTIFGARKLRIHQKGDILDGSMNTFAFIDDDHGSAYSDNTNQFAEGWVDGQDTYIGFFIFSSGRFGWMKVAVDLDNLELVVKEMAYDDVGYAPIEVGYTGQPEVELPNVSANDGKTGEFETNVETSVEELTTVQDLAMIPNPASEKFVLAFNNTGSDHLNIVITNNLGQEMYRTANVVPPGEFTMEVSVANWSPGIYYVRFQGEEGIKTELISIVR